MFNPRVYLIIFSFPQIYWTKIEKIWSADCRSKMWRNQGIPATTPARHPTQGPPQSWSMSSMVSSGSQVKGGQKGCQNGLTLAFNAVEVVINYLKCILTAVGGSCMLIPVCAHMHALLKTFRCGLKGSPVFHSMDYWKQEICLPSLFWKVIEKWPQLSLSTL